MSYNRLMVTKVISLSVDILRKVLTILNNNLGMNHTATRQVPKKLNSTPKTAFKNVLIIELFVSVSVSFLNEHTLKMLK